MQGNRCHCTHAQSLHSCPTLGDPVECSPPGSSVHGILQARIMKWVAMPSSRGSSRPMDWTHISHVSCISRRVLYTSTTWEALLLLLLLSRFSRVRLCATPETAAHQALLSLGFSRQEHWSGLPSPPMHGSERWKVKVKSLSCVRLLATPWTAAHQVSLSMGFSRQEYWSGVPLSLGRFKIHGIKCIFFSWISYVAHQEISPCSFIF